MQENPYNDLNTFLRTKFGCRVWKITVDAGFTCPNRDGTAGVGGCIYCNERGSGTGASGNSTITEQVQSAKAFLHKRYKAEKYLAYFQSFSNTYAPVEILERFYNEALEDDDIVGLIIGTRPDCVSDEVLDCIERFNRKTYVSLEYGLQSIHDRTLKLINRGHTFADFTDAVERTRRRNIDVTVHVILGLPGESREDMLDTTRVLADMDIQGIKIHLLYVVNGTPLHQMFDSNVYTCMGREEYIDTVCEYIKILPRKIVVHRLTGDPHRE